MKISFSPCTPHSHQNSVAAVESLRV
ncbi:regulator, partial [Klebsiella michiganensis]|nr:regulator [Klebsiella michiganensis]